MPVVPRDVLDQYGAISLYNSPYGAHDDGRAIDCYPEPRWNEETDGRPRAPSPVAGEVVAIERFGAPAKPYAPPEDVVLAIDTGAASADRTYSTADGEPAVARLLHVDPAVEVGDRVAVGDDLGALLRSGFFAPWVDPHLHLEFRSPGADLLRAGGSLPLDVAVEVRAVAWDGRGTVTEVGETYAILDRPRHPAPGEAFAALGGTVASDDGTSGASVPLDGGLPHYEFGGLLGRRDAGAGRTVSLLGEPVGRTDDSFDCAGQASGRRDGAHASGRRDGTAGARGDESASAPDGTAERSRATHAPVHWNGPIVTLDGEPIRGLSLAAGREALGVKLVCPDREPAVGETVQVGVER